MLKLSIEEIICKIKQEEIFEAVSDDYSFTIKIMLASQKETMDMGATKFTS